MKIGQAIRENLSVCGDCVNCKLVAWSGDAEKKNLMRNVSTINVEKIDEIEGRNAYYIVNCSWLKYAVAEPSKLTKCEGKKTRD